VKSGGAAPAAPPNPVGERSDKRQEAVLTLVGVLGDSPPLSGLRRTVMGRIRDLSRRAKAGLGASLLAVVVVGGLVVADGPERGQGVEVLGATADRSGDIQIAAGAQPAKPNPDTTPPSISVLFPQNNRVYDAGAWGAGCSPAGVCGSASDPSGVSQVQVAVRQTSSGKYWNAAANAFSSTAAVFNPAAGTGSWKLALPLPADGAYTVLVQATDGPGNATPASKRVSVGFTVDTAAPAAPVISRHPDDVTFDTSADFGFTDGERGVTFRCQLDGNAPAACSSSPTFRNLSETDHVLQVWAVDGAGNQSGPVSFSWTVALRRSFGISGDATHLLSPGVSVPLDMTLANPYNFAIRVLDVSVSATGPTACPAAANLTATASSFSAPVVIPAHSSRSLSALGVPPAQRPQVLLRNLASNQDSCKNAKFTLTYSGTGTKS
jgi:hypothetical protein